MIFGEWGEDEASKMLIENGYKLIERNRKTKSGEIDIIAEDEEALVFIEVKTRTTNENFPAEYAVDFKKQKKILKCANEYILSMETPDIPEKPCRFDVVIINKSGKIVEINIIKNAFQADNW